MLSGITRQHLWRKSSRSKPSTPSTDPRPTRSVVDVETSLEFHHNDDPNHEGSCILEELNTSLAILVSVFPHVQPEVFRELLCNFKEESRLNLVVEALLKDKDTWVRGRWQTTQEHGKGTQSIPEQRPLTDGNRPLVRARDTFRSQEYKRVVEQVLRQEFKGIGRSVVKAVLAENNFYYTDSRPVLLRLASKSWKYSLASWVSRRKQRSPYDEALIIWTVLANGEVDARLKLTPSHELNAELHATIVAPLWQERVEKQMAIDRTLAEKINDAEAEEAGATFECQCCYVSRPFESITACTDGHFICFRCIRHTVNEALFGQGWTRSIDTSKLSLRCIASTSDGPDECQGCVSQSLLRAALLSQAAGEETWNKFEERAAQESLTKSNLLVVKCPFCPWAEARDPPFTYGLTRWTGTITNLNLPGYLLALVPICLALVFLLSFSPTFAIAAIFVAFLHLITTSSIRHGAIYTSITSALTTRPAQILLQYGERYTCRNPACGRVSCLSCSGAWADIHICHESSRLALRQHIEAAQAEAIKRTCPRCSTSFIKESGCNKLVCPCGYKMCYLCRKELDHRQPYSHFCQHFRSLPGTPCGECDACELYKDEDDDEIVRLSGARAEKEWLEREARELAEGPGSTTLPLDPTAR